MYKKLSVSSRFRLDGNIVGMSRLKCSVARQNARSDRVCLDFSLVTFFVAMTKKVTIIKEKILEDLHF